MTSIMRNQVLELAFQSEAEYGNPTRDLELQIEITPGNGDTFSVPGFWDGGGKWGARFSAPADGEFSYLTVCSNPDDSGLHGQSGSISVQGENDQSVLTREGPISIASDGRHFAHASGRHFSWLGDTWWMGLTRRLPLEGFKELIADRVSKGFSVIQIIAGLYPDMPWRDPRGEGEAGYPWSENFDSLNPSYFQKMDRRIRLLVENGLSPCIVGFWGYFMDTAGPEALKLHWRNLVARYAAYPVTWCIAGEGLMPFYLDAHKIEDMDAWTQERSAAWSDMARHVAGLDGYGRPITIHPTNYGRRQVDDPGTLDFEMLQTGHGGFPALSNTVDLLEESLAAEPRMPVIISEVNYEGILESSGPEIQRFLYWSSMLSGAGGFTYGANGLWQVNGTEVPYGKSPHGMSWGGPSWRGASQLAGGAHIGLAKKLFDGHPWWTLESVNVLLSFHSNPFDRIGPFAGAMEDGTHFIFVPAVSILQVRRGGLRLYELQPGADYDVSMFNPKTGEMLPSETISANAYGQLPMPLPPIIQDWVFVVSSVSG